MRPSFSTPWPMTRQLQWAQDGARAWMAHSKLSNVCEAPRTLDGEGFNTRGYAVVPLRRCAPSGAKARGMLPRWAAGRHDRRDAAVRAKTSAYAITLTTRTVAPRRTWTVRVRVDG